MMTSNLQQRTAAVNRVISLARAHGAVVLEKDLQTTNVRISIGHMVGLIQAGRDGSGFCKTRWYVDYIHDPALQKDFEDNADRKIFGIGQRRNAATTVVLLKYLEEQLVALKAQADVPVAA